MRKREITALILSMLFLQGAVTPAYGHSFKEGGLYYERLIEGAYVVVAYPGILLPILAAGILAGVWKENGVLRSLPLFASGVMIGVPFSALVGPQVAVWLIALGVLTATLTALLSSHSRIEVLGLLFATGLMAIMASLEGHGLFELDAFIYVGICLTAIYIFALLAGATRMMHDKFPANVTNIAFRVASSWIAAALMLFLAFELRA